MDKAEKNKISHRGKALNKLKEWLATHAQALVPVLDRL